MSPRNKLIAIAQTLAPAELQAEIDKSKSQLQALTTSVKSLQSYLSVLTRAQKNQSK